MRAAKPCSVLIAAALASLLCAAAYAAPGVVFSTETISVTPNTTYDSPSVVVQEAGDLTAVDVDIVIPAGITLDTSVSGTSLACLTPGTGTSMFFASWDASTRRIQITCILGPTGHVAESIRFTTPADVALDQITLVKPIDRGNWPAGTAFGSLTLQPPHEVSIVTNPAVTPGTVDSGAAAACSVSAADSLGHTVSYQWSDGGAGGSFSPSAAVQNPTYTAPTNKTGSNTTVTLSVTASCADNAGINSSGSVTLAVRSHHITVTAEPSTDPTVVASGGQANCAFTAADSLGHTVSYQWSDGGAGGSFSPSAAVQNPTYTAPTNNTGADTTVTLAAVAACAEDSTLSVSRTVGLTVSALPPVTLEVSSSPSSSVTIGYAQGSASGTGSTGFSRSYSQGTTGVTLTAPETDGAANPRYFEHWLLDDVPQPDGQKSITFDMGASNRSAQAVYGRLVGDLDANGKVQKDDADLILQALMGESPQTEWMDVNFDGNIDLKDAAWILAHLYDGTEGGTK